MTQALEGSTAVWVDDRVTYAQTLSSPAPVFLRPRARGAERVVVGRAARRPAAVARLLARGASARDVAAGLMWLETAAAFDVRSVQTLDGSPSPLDALVPVGSAPEWRSEGGTRPAVTGLLIAQDEEGCIGAALRSLTPFVDELVVLDGGSRDDTVAVAQAHGARVHTRTFDRDFAAQRNAALEHVRTPWVFTLDCDEVVPAELGNLVSRLLPRARTDALVVPRISFLDDGDVPVSWPDALPRVHRKELRYRRPVHEVLQFATAVHLPLDGPALVHRKSAEKHWRSSLAYSEVDPGQATPRDVAWMRAELERLRAARTPGEST